MKRDIWTVWILQLWILVVVFEPVSADLQLFRIEQSFSTCQVWTTSNRTKIIADQMCNLRREGTSCVFEASHEQVNGTYYREHGCAICPVTLNNAMCTLIQRPKINSTSNNVNTVCCCKSPNCLSSMYNDSEIGWSQNNGSCMMANYDSLRKPQWEKDKLENSCKEDSCFMAVRESDYKDYGNDQKRRRIMMKLGCGCPSGNISADGHVYSIPGTSNYCCKGPNCNQKLFRMIGFEWIQNTLLMQEEREFFQHLTSGKKRHVKKLYVGDIKFQEGRTYRNIIHSVCIAIVFAFLILVLIFCPPKDLHTLPARIHLGIKEKPIEFDDDDLIFGEL
uniref:Uncharacterized protein n=2 Tax=Caenorhabditis japonica TaxID=281687 RepID=A0A8R1HYY2_CAEJA